MKSPSSPQRSEGELVGGKYKLEGRLGEGGMGVVFAARHMGTRRRVAVKCLASHANSITAKARFMREAQVAGRIDHPNVVQVLDVGEDARGRYIVMECLQGETLADVLDRRKLAPADAVDVLIPALRGVHAAHKQGIVHRDLKPENIFVCRAGDGPVQIKVLDFGISKFLEDDVGEQLTRSGVLLGTPQYMSPDRVAGTGHSDRRNDIYAMGVILYEALSGRRAFDGDDLLDVMKRVARLHVTPLEQLEPSLPPALVQIVRKAMAADAADRYQDVESFARALEPFAGFERFAPHVRDPTDESADSQARLAPAASAAPRALTPPRPPPPLARRPNPADDAGPESPGARPPPPPPDVRRDPQAAFEAFRAQAMAVARPVRELMFQLSLGRTPRGWANAARAIATSLLEAARRSELKEIATALERLEQALKRAGSGASPCIESDGSVALRQAYQQLSVQAPEAFPPESESDARRHKLFEAVLLRAPKMRSRALAKLLAAGVTSFEQLGKATAAELAAATGIDRELAQALVRRSQQFERERQYQDLADLQVQVERRLRSLPARLSAMRIEFERAERDDAADRKRSARQSREAVLLELNQLLLESGEAELAAELERSSTAGKIELLERHLKRAPAAVP